MPSLLQSFRRRLSILPGAGGGRRNHSGRVDGGEDEDRKSDQRQQRRGRKATTRSIMIIKNSQTSSSSPVSVVYDLLNDNDNNSLYQNDHVDDDIDQHVFDNDDDDDNGNDSSPSSAGMEGDIDAQQTTNFSTSSSNAVPSSYTPIPPCPLQQQQIQHDHLSDAAATTTSSFVSAPTQQIEFFFSSTTTTSSNNNSLCATTTGTRIFESCGGGGNDENRINFLMMNSKSPSSPEYLISVGQETIPKSSPPSGGGGGSDDNNVDEEEDEAREFNNVQDEIVPKEHQQQQQQQPTTLEVVKNNQNESSFVPTTSGGGGHDNNKDPPLSSSSAGGGGEYFSAVQGTTPVQQQEHSSSFKNSSNQTAVSRDDHDDDDDDGIMNESSSSSSVEYLSIQDGTVPKQQQTQQQQSTMEDYNPTLPMPAMKMSSPFLNGPTRPISELDLLNHHSPSMISELTTTLFGHYDTAPAVDGGTTTSMTTTTTTSYYTPKEQILNIPSLKSTMSSRPNTPKQQASSTTVVAAVATPVAAPPRRSDENANDIIGKRVEIIAGINKKYKFGFIQQWKNENTLKVRVNTNTGSSATTIVNVRNTSIRVLVTQPASTLPLLENVLAVKDEQNHDKNNNKMIETSDAPKAIQVAKEASADVQLESHSLKNHSLSVPVDDVDDHVQANVALRPKLKLSKRPVDVNNDKQSAAAAAITTQTATPTMNSLLRPPTPKLVQQDNSLNRPVPNNNVQSAADARTSTANSVLTLKLVPEGGNTSRAESNNDAETTAVATPTTPNVKSLLRPTPKPVQQDDNQQSNSSINNNNKNNPSRGKNNLLNKRVKITKGDKKHKGKLGTVTNDNDKRSIKIKLDEGGLVVGKALSSLEIIETDTPSHDTGIESHKMNETVNEEDTTNASPRISLRRHVAARLSLNRATATKVTVPKASSSTFTNSKDTGMVWRVSGHNHGGMKFGRFRVAKLRLQDENAKNEITFLSHLLGDRILVVDVPLNGRKDQKQLDKTIERDGCKYELVSVKEHDDNDQGSFGFSKSKLLRLMYAQVEGHDISSFSIEEMLLNLGNFSLLNPRKIMARLELLQSPAKFNIVFISQHHFQTIDDKGYVGCGFISDEMLIRICTEGGMSKTHAIRVVALQVRLFIPTMGIYKGMLMRSPLAGINGGGDDIQLPASMLKVLKSTNPEALQDAAILVCKNGVHPSPGSANEYIGRRLDANRNDPPEKSFKEKIKKPLSDMVFRLWRTLGVPDYVCNVYKKESLKTSGRNHAWLVGVADPTGGGLPTDCIFIPGTQSLVGDDDNVDKKFFVTRSPCVKAEDGRMLLIVTRRPKSMSVAHWEWLNSLDFGCIIFSNPRPGQKSIPERIASGDLDGDLYLVCWDEKVLSYIQAEPLVDEPSEDDVAAAAAATSPTEDEVMKDQQNDDDPQQWFQNAQNIMMDARLVNDMGRLTGKCYKLAESIADASGNKHLILRHEDSIALMQAYTDALEFKKHGGKIRLPLHLHDKIMPKHLQQYLTAT